MSQNGQKHFENLAEKAAWCLMCVFDHFGRLCNKGLKPMAFLVFILKEIKK